MARGKSPSTKTRLLVWGRAAGICQFPNCRNRLDQDLISGNLSQNKAYLAHIIASDPGGRRGDQVLSPLHADDPENIMLMCDAHHREIDGEKTWHKYPVEELRKIKVKNEQWIATTLSAGLDSRSDILQFSAPIGPNETAVPFDDCVNAILPEKTPAGKHPLEIKIRGMRHKDSDPSYWDTELRVLRERFAQDIAWRFESGEIRHLSVFALAPIPLLIELGRLLSDISDTSVFERHREPTGQWAWPEDGAEVNFHTQRGSANCKRVALKLSVTSEITDDRIERVFGSSVSIWDISSDIHGTGIIRHKSDLSRFRSIVGKTLDDIKNEHGADVELSVFPALPVSCAVEFGRVWQPKAHPDMGVYDQVQGKGFLRRLRIA